VTQVKVNTLRVLAGRSFLVISQLTICTLTTEPHFFETRFKVNFRTLTTKHKVRNACHKRMRSMDAR
jgi:hypothetical protein